MSVGHFFAIGCRHTGHGFRHMVASTFRTLWGGARIRPQWVAAFLIENTDQRVSGFRRCVQFVPVGLSGFSKGHREQRYRG